MGRSAKLHKRVPKKLKAITSNSSSTTPSTTPNPSQSKAQTAKKRADLKAKAAKAKPSTSASSGKKEGHVLGGADYVSLLLGGRRKAREEAEKLPHDEE